jgi:mannose-6-phosphate isomerase-like protein (cupin superfamily)
VKSCQVASVIGAGTLVVMIALAACREAAQPEVPGVTTARPSDTTRLASDVDAALVVPPSRTPLGDADSATEGAAPPPHATVAFLEGTKKLESPVCSRLFIVAVRGTVKVSARGPEADSLAQGDVLVLVHPEPVEVTAPGLAVEVLEEFTCSVLSRPPQQKTLVPGKDAAPLVWANGTMRAQLDVGTKLSPNLYLGRLEGKAPVAEHEHATSSETLVAIEASGTFTLDGKDSRLGARQIVHVPKGTKHAWKPDPGTKLVAIQIYEPPGPEQRFIGLAAAAKDAGADAGKGLRP